MSSHRFPSLDKLKEALQHLERQVAPRREQLQAALAAKKPIGPDDEAWLDNEANLVDEHRVVSALEEAADYESGLKALTAGQKEAIARLEGVLKEKLTGKSTPGEVVGGKRKRPEDAKTTAGQPKKKTASKPAFEKKENARLDQRIEILNWYHANSRNQTKTANHFDAIYPNLKLKQPTVSSWVKDEKYEGIPWTKKTGADKK